MTKLDIQTLAGPNDNLWSPPEPKVLVVLINSYGGPLYTTKYCYNAFLAGNHDETFKVLLQAALAAGYSRQWFIDNVAITNYIEAIAETNRPPTPEEIAASHIPFWDRVHLMQPEGVLSIVGVTSGLREHVRNSMPDGVRFAESCHPAGVRNINARFQHLVDAIKKAFN